MKKTILPLIFLISTLRLYSQGDWCYSDERLLASMNSPNYLNYVKQASTSATCPQPFVTGIKRVKVKVHVMHDGNNENQVIYEENISDDQIYSAINSLNYAFRGKKGGADCEIEFCLVGVSRHSTSLSANLSIANDDAPLKAIVHDDPTQYLNIYVVEKIEGGGVFGYSSFPWEMNANSSIDGIVIDYLRIGTIGAALYNQNQDHQQNAVLIHEVGHWLGLLHTFAHGIDETEAACLNTFPNINGDMVWDTPPSASSHSGCPTGVNSCNTDNINGQDLPDMVENFMEYTTDQCRTSFTDGQKTRMHTQIELLRSNVYTIESNSVDITGIVVPSPICQSQGFLIGSQNFDNYSIRLIDLTGQEVMNYSQSIPFMTGTVSIPIPQLAGGMYGYTVTVGNSCTRAKTSGTIVIIGSCRTTDPSINTIVIKEDRQATNPNYTVQKIAQSCELCKPFIQSTLNNEIFNYGAIPVDHLGSDLSVTNSATLAVNGNYTRNYYFPANPSSNCTLIVCNNAVLDVLQTSNFLLGDNSIASRSTVIFKSGTKLIIRNGASLNVQENSKLIFEPGATLVIEPAANITVSNNAMVEVQDNATFDLQFSAGQTTWIKLEGPTSLFDVATTANISLPALSTLKFSPGNNVQPGGGTVRFAKGNLEHNTKTKLILEKCNLIFDYAYDAVNGPPQMIYWYAVGAELRLLQDGVLDIRGDLRLVPQTTPPPVLAPVFKFNWQGSQSHGYIKFSRPGFWFNSNAPHITAAKNFRWEFIGKNKNDKMLEVATETIYLPDELDSVIFYKALVEFNGDGARLSCNSPYRIQTATFYANPLIGNRGLVVYGQPHKMMYNIWFKNTALTDYAFFNASPQMLKMKNSLFTNAGGISMFGAGFDITATDFIDCANSGIEGKGLTYNSSVSSCDFFQTATKNMPGDFNNPSGHTGTAVNLFASPINLRFSGTKIRGNAEGIFAEQAYVIYHCGELKNNLHGATINANASINMSHPNYDPQNPDPNRGGWVDASDNGTTFALNNAYAVELNEGGNNLKPFTSQSQCYANNSTYLCNNAIIGTIAPPSNYSPPIPPPGVPVTPHIVNISADANYWQEPQGTTYQQQNNFYPSWMIHNITYEGFPNTEVRLIDAAEYTSPNSLPGCNNNFPCPNPPNCAHQFTVIDNCPSCNMIVTPHFNNVKVNTALKTALGNMSESISNGYKTASEMLREIMTAQISVHSKEDREIKRIARRNLNASLASAYLLKQIPDSMPNESTLVGAIQALDEVINTPDPGNYMYSEKLFAMMEKAQMYRMARLRTEAITVFGQALAFAQPQDQAYVQKWICHTETELKILKKQLSRDSIDHYFAICNPIQNGNRVINSATRENTVRKEISVVDISPIIKVYPNPASNELFIAYQAEGSNLEFKVFNMEGKLVNFAMLSSDQQVYTIKNLDLPDGIYYYQITSNNTVLKSEKLVIIR